MPFPELAMLFETNRDTMYFVILVVMFILIVITLNIINSPMAGPCWPWPAVSLSLRRWASAC